MTTFIRAKLKKSDDQTNIDKYREAANDTEYHIMTGVYKFHYSPPPGGGNEIQQKKIWERNSREKRRKRRKERKKRGKEKIRESVEEEKKRMGERK